MQVNDENKVTQKSKGKWGKDIWEKSFRI